MFHTPTDSPSLIDSLQGQEMPPELAETDFKHSDAEHILDRSAKEIAELVKENTRLEKVQLKITIWPLL